jgi:cell division septation protein DedD
MTGIDRYISELLFDHDCVILPGVGGFLTNYSGARIHPVRHSFQPASRTVVFNARLRTNDGLLIDHVSRSESIPYQQAALKVNEYAADCIRKLESGEEVILKNIGTCRMGREHNIVFDPDTSNNYLADAFGLPTFVSPAIKRETVRQRLEKQLGQPTSGDDERKKRKPVPIINWAAGLALPITAALLLYMYAPDLFNGPGKSYASFVPGITLEPAEAVKIPVNDKTAVYKGFRNIPEKAEEAQPVKAPPQPEPATVKKYQVIVGAFARESNAEKYVEELRNRNYRAAIIGQSSSGLTRVSISGFDLRKDALQMLSKVRASENPSAWLLVIR